MDATALSISDPVIQIHAYSAVLALVLGAVVLLRRKGDRLHKAMGRTWIGVMAVVAISSFFITEVRMFGPYSLIHLLSAFTLFALVEAVWLARSGNIRGHRRAVATLYAGALILAGAFTLLPGRRMHAVVFADGGLTAGLVALGVAALVGTALVMRRRAARRTPRQAR